MSSLRQVSVDFLLNMLNKEFLSGCRKKEQRLLKPATYTFGVCPSATRVERERERASFAELVASGGEDLGC